MIFYTDDKKEYYGRIEKINDYGTHKQRKEVSYHIIDVQTCFLYKNITESKIIEGIDI